MPNKNTKEESIKAVLKLIKEKSENSEILIKKDIAHSMKFDPRYNQGFLDVLEGMGLIKVETLGTSDMVSLTDEGKEFLEK